MPARKVRISGTRNSLHSNDSRGRYSDSNEKVVYVRDPRRNYVDSGFRREHVHPRRRGCLNRFCVGICNFFHRLKATDYEEEHGYAPPAICYSPSNHRGRKSNPRENMQTAVSLTSEALLSHICKEEDFQSGPDRDYIIYIPRVSRHRLGRDYLEPLCKAAYEPIIIRRCNRNMHRRCECEQCRSCVMDVDQKQNSFTHSANADSSFVDSPRLQCRNKTFVQPSGRSSMEALSNSRNRGERKVNRSEEELQAFGDLGDSNKRGSGSKGSTPAFLYIAVKGDSRYGSHHSFQVHEKNISWASIRQRHDTAARNRQAIMQETKDRLQTYSAIWTRRKLIGERKKALAKDPNSVYCSPPAKLESRFHHIHWLGNTGNKNNSVGRYFDVDEKCPVALKIFSHKPFATVVENLDNKLMAIQEINSLQKLKHRNIVTLLGYFEFHDKFHLILESCVRSLREDIKEASSGLGTSTSKKIIKSVLNGLHYCHQAKCLHRDLSPENIVISKEGIVKIADFDRSVFLTESSGAVCPTPGSYVYNSPEILAGDKEYGLPSDVWSLGIIFCELLTGKPPWNGRSAQNQLREIHNCVGPLLPRHASVAKLHVDEKSYTVHNHAQLQQMFTTISAPCCSFITKCLDVNPLCRFTCGELMQHQFMKGNYH